MPVNVYSKEGIYKVKLVMNITDIDDKTIRDSKAAGVSLKDFTDKYTAEFFKGLDMLNIKRASAYPRATENIGSMIELAQKLIDKGLAYEKGGSVYYRISSFPDYGKLSKLDFNKIKVGASVDVDEYDKDNPRDFALLRSRGEFTMKARGVKSARAGISNARQWL